ncbi:histidinol-phosphatase [Pelagibacterium montanilacus]|uniref:histidinol-phosphatase n=1 Tax=Pelagibacterium montanilacus TaxID=2185280 RepID=UPI000F8F45F0|nr:histidinol-phosphatase [Pelagibacterium montanilacus]
MPSSIDQITDSAIRSTMLAASAAASDITLGMFRTGLSVDNKLKSGFDPVTAADRDAETVIRGIISDGHPTHGIIGEEWDALRSESTFTWIIDPIDGTRAYIAGVPVWGTLIGLLEGDRPVAGLMHQPFIDECWIATGGQTLYRRSGVETPARTSAVTSLARARATTTSPEIFQGPHTVGWSAIRDAVLQVRYGLDCYGYCLLASGHIDLVVETELKDVDIAPLIPIIEGAGGVVSTWDGGPAARGGTCVAAATPELHAQALALLRRAVLE